nr:GNAT family N-acetyltransferase [uncultured Noviherbaspirillum sp.]
MSTKEPENFSPLMASVWADAVIAYWQAANVQQALDPDQPLDVLDLMPGSGESSLIMLRALAQRLHLLPDFVGALRYLLVGPSRALLDASRWQPEVRACLQANKIVPLLWDPGRDDPCLLHPGKRLPWRPINPVAVLAHDGWERLEQRLCAVHYGRLLEAKVGNLANCTSPAEEAREWHPLQTGHVNDRLTSLIKSCLSKFNSAPIPLPMGAIAMHERIASLASSGYLILASAPGLVSERQIRLHHFSDLIAHYRSRAAMPVNFYLLDEYGKTMGAISWQSELRPGCAVQLTVGNLPDPSRALSAALAFLKSGDACDAPSLVEAARAVASMRSGSRLNVLLALIRRAQYDPAVFNAAAFAIVDDLRSNPRVERTAWSEALERIWLNHLPVAHRPALHRKLAPAAMRVGAWRLARQVLTRGMEVHGEHALDLAHLAWCEMRTGHGTKALGLIKRAAALDASDATVQEVMHAVTAKVLGWNGGWSTSVSSQRLPISLEPLDVGHAEALSHQYRDPQIAFMTGLQSLTTLEATRKWIIEHVAEPGRKPYALMHSEHGFVGYVCLSVTAQEAYFCFWIGVDFQGERLSVEAACLLCALAKCQGVAHVFTSAYKDNARSLGALMRSGFSRLDIHALAPENDRIFFFLNLTDTPVADPASLLFSYYESEKLPLYFPGQEQRQAADQAVARLANEAKADHSEALRLPEQK